MTPAEEKIKLDTARHVIETLRSGEKTLVDLFGPMSGADRAYNQRIVILLESGGIVRRQPGNGHHAGTVRLINTKELTNEALSHVIWPSSKPPVMPLLPPLNPMPPEEVFITAQKAHVPSVPVVVPEVQVAPVAAPTPSGPVPFNPPVDVNTQLLERLLVVMEAACQSIIYTREKVDAMEADVQSMKADLRVLAEAFK